MSDRYRPTAWEHIDPEAFFELRERKHGRIEVRDKASDERKVFATRGDAERWVTEEAETRIVRGIMTS
jgi:hypothetical protein